jgi:iron complex outermembrane receptor protein
MRKHASIHDCVRGRFVLALILGLGWPAFAAAQEPGGAAPPPDDSAQVEPAAPAGAAQAAEPADPGAVPLPVGGPTATPKPIEEVIITGTRIQTGAGTGLGPISTFEAEDLTLKGAFSVGELLRNLPSVGFGGFNATNTNGGRGLETIDLRDLGAARTLILVNGRRFVQSSSGLSEAVDLNNLPPQLIERVDVLRDGVSTIYGADAVAGVVNFILKKDFEGLELFSSAGVNQRRDGEAGEFSLIWGKNFDRGNLTLTGSVSGRRPMKITDREFSKSPIFVLEPNTQDGGFDIIRDVYSPRDGVVFSEDNPALNRIFFKPSADGTQSFSRGFVSERDGTKINDQFALTGGTARRSVNGIFTFNFSDAVQAFSELTYTRRDSRQRFLEVEVDDRATVKNPLGLTIPVFPNMEDGTANPRNSPFLPIEFVDAAFKDADGNPLPRKEKDADGNPLPGTPDSVNIALLRGLGEFGRSDSTNESETFRFAGGLKGELPSLFQGARWEVYGNYGRNGSTEIIENDVNLTRLLNSLQPELCAKDPQCVLADVFGPDLRKSPGALRYLKFDSRDELVFNLREVASSMEASLFDLPAGPVRAAIGAEYREEDGSVKPDPRLVSGDTGQNSREGTRGSQTIREAFFETEIPVLKDLPAAEALSLQVSGRYTDYSSFGGRYLSRYGFSWTPLSMVRFRGVYSTAFRAPGISDLFLGRADAFRRVRDRCAGFPNVDGGGPEQTEKLRQACEAALPAGRFDEANPFVQRNGIGAGVLTNSGGNTELSEETATNLGLGVSFAPPWIENLELSVDYYDVEIQDPIVPQSAQVRVDNCLLRGSQADCAGLTRGADGSLDVIELPRTNFGRVSTSGLEFDVRYDFPSASLGDITVDFSGNYIMDFEVLGQSQLAKQNGVVGVPNFKGLLTVSMRPTDAWTFQATTRYIGGGEDPERKRLGLPLSSTKDIMYVDLVTQYKLGAEGKYMFTFGVSNLMDQQPPRLVNSFTNADLSTYEYNGRRFFAAFRTTFY